MQFDHYTIRPLAMDDLDLYYALIDRNRPRLESYFVGTVARTRTYADTELYMAERLQLAAERTYLPFVLYDNDAGQFAGFLDVKNIDWNIPKAELGCYADEAYAGKGITTHALELFTRYCFTELGFEKLFLRTHETNTAARKMAEKCGFQVEGILRKDYKTVSGELLDLVYYGKLKGE